MSRRFCPCHAVGQAATARSRDRQRGVGHHRRFRHLEHPAQAVALRAGALRGVRRKIFGVEHRLPRQIAAGARIKHAQQAGERRHAAHRRARVRRAALLLQRHRRRQAVDAVDIGHADLVDQPASVGRDRLEVAPLRLGVDGAEGQRRLAGARHPGEHHKRVAGHIDVHALQVVLPRAPDAHHISQRFARRLAESAHWTLASHAALNIVTGADFQRASRQRRRTTTRPFRHRP